MIKLEKVSKYYHSNGVSSLGLYNINLELKKGEIVAITGESGSGKTTLLNVIAKIDTFDSGEIYYNNEATSYYEVEDLDEFRKNKIGFIFQNYQILDSYSVLDNVKLPLLLKGYNNADAKKEAKRLIDKVGLSNRIHSKGSKLSGGEKQRCVIARALAADCEILACDEPTGNLDSQTAKEIIDLILELAQDKLVLIVTHNLPEIKPYATRIIKMSDGKIIEDIQNKPDSSVNDEILENNNQNQIINKRNNNHLLKIAFQNILFTPMKSIFLVLVFFVISFIYLIFVGLIYCIYNDYDPTSNYKNTFDNLVFCYNDHLNSITEEEQKELNKYEVLYDNYTISKSVGIEIGKLYRSVVIAKNIPNTTLLFGEMPKNENEFVLCVHEMYKENYEDLQTYIGKHLQLSESYYYCEYIYNRNESIKEKAFVTDFIFTGICTYSSSNTSDDYLIGSDKLSTCINNINKTISISLEGYNEFFLNFNTKIIEDSDKFEIIVPEKYKNNKLHVYFADTYETSAYTLIYDKDIDEITIKLGLNYTSNEKFFAEIYFDNNTSLQAKKLGLQLKNLSFILPSRIEKIESIDTLLNKITGLVMVILLSFLLIIVFIVTYFILSRVYKSKNNDYQILRTLGVTKKKMSYIVNFEIILIGTLSIIISMILYFILINRVPDMFIFKSVTTIIYFVYIVIMEFFVFSISKRFNKRLFKFTIATNLKDGGSND